MIIVLPNANLLVFFLLLVSSSSSQKSCPNCGSIQVPYPLSTGPKCGDNDYPLRCDSQSGKLFFDALNGSSYPVLKIMPAARRMVVQTSSWLPGHSCVAQDLVSEGLLLNRSLPFNVTSANTIFLFNCSPRLLVSPLNCTPSSLCHHYLESSGRVDPTRAFQCANDLHPCCTFLAGGMPSAFKIRLHSSGCRAFRSVLNLDPAKPANQWEEGLEIQWAAPLEPLCKSQSDCLANSKCSQTRPNGLRCICNQAYHWDSVVGTCLKSKTSKAGVTLEVSIGVAAALVLALVIAAVILRKAGRFSNKAKLTKEREDMVKSSNGGKPAKLFSLKEMKKATNGFSRNQILGIGGSGEVYKGMLKDGTIVAVKSAKVGNLKSTQQVLNEVGILSQVNHRNLVRLLGCCIESEQPLMVYEYISNGTLHDHLHGKFSNSTSLSWRTRLKIALQTAEALAYLHSAVYNPIYHRDVKSTNILLDDDFNSKVADFGLSRLAAPGLSHVSTCAQGTLGYLDPEYYRNYQLTEKSDVYSYGVVLLELLTSQRAIDFSRNEHHVNLAVYVSQMVKSGAAMEVVDKQLIGEGPSVESELSIKLFTEIALACLREKKAERPAMKDVAQQIECIMDNLDKKDDSNSLRPTSMSDTIENMGFDPKVATVP